MTMGDFKYQQNTYYSGCSLFEIIYVRQFANGLCYLIGLVGIWVRNNFFWDISIN